MVTCMFFNYNILLYFFHYFLSFFLIKNTFFTYFRVFLEYKIYFLIIYK
nr:MAG TPA: hypothetical protein [Caudoviricetes sp.]